MSFFRIRSRFTVVPPSSRSCRWRTQFCAMLFFVASLSLTKSQSTSGVRLTSTLRAVEEGGPVTLTCHFSSPYAQTDVIWIQNNRRIDVKAAIHRTRNYSDPFRQELIIPRFTKSQNGTYRCQTRNTKSNKVTVFLTGKPILNVTNSYISVPEGSSILVNVSIKNYKAGYLKFSLVNKFDNETVPGSTKAFQNIFTNRSITLLVSNISPRFDGRLYVKVWSLLTDTTEKGVYKAALHLHVKRKLPPPRLSVSVGQLSATLLLSLPPINPKYFYDSVKELKIKTVKTGKPTSDSSSHVLVSADVKRFKINFLEPGENYTSFATTLGEKTESDTSFINFQTNCFGKELPYFFFDIKTKIIFMNSSGLALPVTLHPDSEPFLNLNISIAGQEVTDNLKNSLAYRVKIDWAASNKNQSLVLNPTFCPKVIKNSLQFLNYSELKKSKSFFGTKGPTTDKPTTDGNLPPTSNLSSSSNSTAADDSSKTIIFISFTVAGGILIVVTAAFLIKRWKNQKKNQFVVSATSDEDKKTQSERRSKETFRQTQTQSRSKPEQENEADEFLNFSKSSEDNATAVLIRSEAIAKDEREKVYFERKKQQEDLECRDNVEEVRDDLENYKKTTDQRLLKLEKVNSKFSTSATASLGTEV